MEQSLFQTVLYGSQEDDENYVPKDIDVTLFVEEEADGSGTTSSSTARAGTTSGLPNMNSSSSSNSVIGQNTSRSAGDNAVVLVDDVPVDTDLFDEEEEDVDEEDEDEDGDGDDENYGDGDNGKDQSDDQVSN